MALTRRELDKIMEGVRRKTLTRHKEEAIVRISVYVASALRQGATWDEVREAVAQGRLMHDPTLLECEGHPAGPYDPMGETVYCDGSCKLNK